MITTGAAPDAARLDPDYAAGKAAIEANDWTTAITLLSSAGVRDTRNADIQNYLGYAYRRRALRGVRLRVSHYPDEMDAVIPIA